MYRIIIIADGLSQCAFSFCLGKAKTAVGFSHTVRIALFLVFCALSMCLLLKAIRVLPLSTAYTVWTGIGAIGTVLLGFFYFMSR